MFAFSESFIAAIRNGDEELAFELASSEQFDAREAYMVTEANPGLADIHAWIRDHLMNFEEDEDDMPEQPPRQKRVLTPEEEEPVTLGTILAAVLHARR